MRSGIVPLAMSTHPGPAVAVTLITVGLGVGGGLDGGRIAILALAMLANQASVGLSNDWIDADRDRTVGRSDKPVAQGRIAVAVVRRGAWISAATSILLTLLLGWPATVAQAIFLVSAWSYNAGLKKTPFSVIPYIVSFGILPSIVTLSRTDAVLAAPWVFAVGALLGVAAHFANVLPDLEDDRSTGVRGLPHRLGRPLSATLTYLVLAVAALLGFLGSGGAGSPVGGVALILIVPLAVAGIALAGRPARWHFRLIILAALLLVVVLASAGNRMLGA